MKKCFHFERAVFSALWALLLSQYHFHGVLFFRRRTVFIRESSVLSKNMGLYLDRTQARTKELMNNYNYAELKVCKEPRSIGPI
jgi:hypothetical protein